MYALVFDNTFAKQFSKTATFVVFTYPSDSRPQFNHQIHHIQGTSSGSSASLKSKRQALLDQHDSAESLPHSSSYAMENHIERPRSSHKYEKRENSSVASFFTGVLQKRRRKKHQGYARRFFSLDYNSSTLSYYHDRSTLACRGAIPLSLAAIGANATTREISIDSGAEIWHLKASNQKDFEAWKDALELASSTHASQPLPVVGQLGTIKRRQTSPHISVQEEQEWTKVEGLISRVASSREAARRLARDTDPKYLPLIATRTMDDSGIGFNTMQKVPSTEPSPTEPSSSSEYLHYNDRRPFFRRIASGTRPSPSVFKRSVSAQPTIATPLNGSSSNERAPSAISRDYLTQSGQEENLHENCMALLHDLNTLVAEFNAVIAESKRRRLVFPNLATSRLSIDSTGSQEFFDAAAEKDSQLLTIQQESEDEEESRDKDATSDAGDSSSSEVEGLDSLDRSSVIGGGDSVFPTKPKSLSPLPLPSVKRRISVPLPTVQPPSLIGFLRKNVGKDLSTISMPVSANEPTSLLQRASEQLEYSYLVDNASTAPSSKERLIYIIAFAVSSLSASRVKERAIRKPFNPMLGETFELVREDKGFRFIAEKVSHRPVRMAYQAEAENWTICQSPMPTQKFWGKSAELITEGRVHVILHNSRECFSWAPATCSLRNVIAGEKYVEPVGTMTVTNETSGEQAVATFKSGGIFSGRSEDIVVQIFDAAGQELDLGLSGKWTSSLSLARSGSVDIKPIWSVGDLVPDSARRYGFTSFAASLNEITSVEQGRMAPTDSRLRPDQRAAENGDFDQAEGLKAKLEESQRERRKVMEDESRTWTPKWFTKIDGLEGEDIWKLKGGKDGYWEARARGDWKTVEQVFAI